MHSKRTKISLLIDIMKGQFLNLTFCFFHINLYFLPVRISKYVLQQCLMEELQWLLFQGLDATVKCEVIDDEQHQENNHQENGETDYSGSNNLHSGAQPQAEQNHSTDNSAESAHISEDNNPKHSPSRLPPPDYKNDGTPQNEMVALDESQFNPVRTVIKVCEISVYRGCIVFFQVTKSLRDEIFNLKLQLNSSKQIRASLELQLCRKEEIILKTTDQLAK